MSTAVVVKPVRLTVKHSKFIDFGFYILHKFNDANPSTPIDEKAFLDYLHIYDTPEPQIELVEGFFASAKEIKKQIAETKKEIQKANKKPRAAKKPVTAAVAEKQPKERKANAKAAVDKLVSNQPTPELEQETIDTEPEQPVDPAMPTPPTVPTADELVELVKPAAKPRAAKPKAAKKPAAAEAEPDSVAIATTAPIPAEEEEEPAEEIVAVEPKKTKAPAKEPKAKAPAKEPKAKAPAKEPKAKAPAKEPKAKAPAKEPKAKAPAKEPKAKAPAAKKPIEETEAEQENAEEKEMQELQDLLNEVDVDDDEEEEMVVCPFTHDGKEYLKNDDNEVFDAETHDLIGKYDGTKIVVFN
jgi:hypothetical protein